MAFLFRRCSQRLFPRRGFSDQSTSYTVEKTRFQQDWKSPGNREIQDSKVRTNDASFYDTKWFGANLNRVILIGFVGQDPVTKTISPSTVAWNFPLSTAYKKKTAEQGEQVITDWHNVTVYAAPTAKFLEQLIQKGNHLFLQGSLHTSTYVDHLGVKRKNWEISVSIDGKGELRLLNRSKKNDNFQKETTLQKKKDETPLPDFQPIKREK